MYDYNSMLQMVLNCKIFTVLKTKATLQYINN